LDFICQLFVLMDYFNGDTFSVPSQYVGLFFIFEAVKTNWLYRIIKYLKKVYFKNDKRVVAYLVCVIIATIFWFLNALSKTYTVNITVPISYVNFPTNKTLASKPPEQYDLRIKAHGFTILRHKLNFLFLPLEFNVNDMTDNRMTNNHKSTFAFPSQQFINEISYQLSNDIEIISMSPDTLKFKFDQMGQKRVKVKPLVTVNLKKQYQISGNIKTIPDSVTVNGPQSTLDTLKFAYTEPQVFNSADKIIHTEAQINKQKELYFEPQQVKLNIPIEEYTEAQLSVPVLLINQPIDSKTKLFPGKVKVSFLVSLGHFSSIHPEDFKLTVSYADIEAKLPRLKIVTESTPPFLYELKISPEELEYLIEK